MSDLELAFGLVFEDLYDRDGLGRVDGAFLDTEVVHALSDDLDVELLRRLCTADDGLVVSVLP